MGKIAISLPDDLLAVIEQESTDRRIPRSGVIREMIEIATAQQERERIRARWQAAYEGITEDDEIALSEAMLAISIFPTLERYDPAPAGEEPTDEQSRDQPSR